MPEIESCFGTLLSLEDSDTLLQAIDHHFVPSESALVTDGL
jgi:hypothetical protein